MTLLHPAPANGQVLKQRNLCTVVSINGVLPWHTCDKLYQGPEAQIVHDECMILQEKTTVSGGVKSKPRTRHLTLGLRCNNHPSTCEIPPWFVMADFVSLQFCAPYLKRGGTRRSSSLATFFPFKEHEKKVTIVMRHTANTCPGMGSSCLRDL